MKDIDIISYVLHIFEWFLKIKIGQKYSFWPSSHR